MWKYNSTNVFGLNDNRFNGSLNNLLDCSNFGIKTKNKRQSKQNKDDFQTQSIFDSLLFTLKCFYLIVLLTQIILLRIVYIFIEQEKKYTHARRLVRLPHICFIAVDSVLWWCCIFCSDSFPHVFFHSVSSYLTLRLKYHLSQIFNFKWS